jgi:serine acetyltransferase
MKRLLRSVLEREHDLIRLRDRARREWLLARIRFLAFWRRSTVVLDVAPDLRVGKRVTVQVAPRTHLSIKIAPRCRIGDEVVLFLTNGTLEWGEDVQLRLRSWLKLGGDLWCEGGNIFSYGTVIHCSESIRLGQWASCAEYTTIVDSAHFYTQRDVNMTENTVSGRIDIGRNVFMAPRVSINRDVTIGDFTIIGPNSVVVSDFASGSFASGVPAKLVRPLDLPWEPAS